MIIVYKVAYSIERAGRYWPIRMLGGIYRLYFVRAQERKVGLESIAYHESVRDKITGISL